MRILESNVFKALVFVVLTMVIVAGCNDSDDGPTSSNPPVDNTTVSETDLLSEINSLRTKPAAYVQYLEAMLPHFNGKLYEEPGQTPLLTNEGAAAVQEAIVFLKAMKPVNPLVWSKGLSRAALDHVNDIGPKGVVSHTGIDGSSPGDRIERYGQWDLSWGENISFGANTARRIMIQLLVDDGVPSRGHRTSMTSPDFTVVGMAFGSHRTYTYMCVQNFAGKYTE